MTESFLHYLWQYQQFDKRNLQTVHQESIRILKTGRYNTDSGPDFLHARLLIGSIEWVGNVEIHIFSSDWNAHAHYTDEAYNNVVLHVVWENNVMICRQDGTPIPTIELKYITNPNIELRFSELIENKGFIPCEKQVSDISTLSKMSMLDKVLVKRLEDKAAFVKELFENNNGDWEETAYQVLAKNFGFKLNSEVFLRLAQNLPLKNLAKHRGEVFPIEAMLFGQSGLLVETDEYSERLSKEYQFYAQKYGLKERKLADFEWKFLRTRPTNFPTIRISQLAVLISRRQSLFAMCTQTASIQELKNLFAIENSVYWQEHHHFAKKTQRKMSGLGADSIENILINSVIPLLVFYSQYIDSQSYMDRALLFLEQISAERNHLTSAWENLGFEVKTAHDSQSLIELYKNYCSEKKCLSCHIGFEILKTQA